jgi:hypothetical protein
MSLTAAQVKTAIQNIKETSYSPELGAAYGFAATLADGNFFNNEYEYSIETDLGTAEQVDYKRNVDNELTLVFQIGTQVFAIDGLYDSYDADEWYINSVREVTPVEKTIIVYENL